MSVLGASLEGTLGQGNFVFAPFLIKSWVPLNLWQWPSHDSHDIRGVCSAPAVLTCRASQLLLRPPNVAPGFASQFLHGPRETKRSRGNRRGISQGIISRETSTDSQLDKKGTIGDEASKQSEGLQFILYVPFKV